MRQFAFCQGKPPVRRRRKSDRDGFFAEFGAPRAIARTALLLLIAAGCAASPEPRAGEHSGLRSVAGTELYVTSLGEGEPVLVVHGGPVLSQQYLRGGLDFLAEDHQLVYFDQRLSGRSAGVVDSSSIRLATFVEDIEAVRRDQGLGAVHLIGHSWGGLLAELYAIRYPAAVRTLTLISPMPESAARWQEEEGRLAARTSAADAALMDSLRSAPGVATGEPDALRALLRASFRSQFARGELAETLDLYVPPDRRERGAQFGHMMPDLADYDVEPQLHQIAAPTLLIYGASEILTEISAPRVASAIPNARLVVIPEAGHFSFLEQPAAFQQALSAFLGGR